MRLKVSIGTLFYCFQRKNERIQIIVVSSPYVDSQLWLDSCIGASPFADIHSMVADESSMKNRHFGEVEWVTNGTNIIEDTSINNTDQAKIPMSKYDSYFSFEKYIIRLC